MTQHLIHAARPHSSISPRPTRDPRKDGPLMPMKKPKMRKYAEPIVPPHPKSRQHLRALLRAQAKVKLP